MPFPSFNIKFPSWITCKPVDVNRHSQPWSHSCGKETNDELARFGKIEAFVAVGATETTSTSDVLGMPLAKRECLKHDENMEKYEDIVLQVFSNYSQKACYLECEARALMSKCDCLPYYFPDFSRVYKKDTNCNVTGLRCLANQYSK